MKKLLVIQLGTAADVLMSTPLLRALKKEAPALELHYLLHHANAEILSGNPYIDHLHQLQFHIQTTIHELAPQAIDGVLNLEPHPMADTIVQELQAPIIRNKQKGFKTFFKNWFPSKSIVHPAEKYLQMAFSLSVQNDGFGLNYFIPRSAEVPYADIPVSHNAGFVALAIANFTQQPGWNAFLKTLLKALDHPIILVGDEGDRPDGEKLAAADAVKIYNACGKFSRHETADLIRKSRLLVSAHPYYLQLAAAFNTPVVWLAANKEVAPPYYSQRFFQTRKEPVYKKLNITFEKEQKSKSQDDFEKVVQQTLVAIRSLLASRS